MTPVHAKFSLWHVVRKMKLRPCDAKSWTGGPLPSYHASRCRRAAVLPTSHSSVYEYKHHKALPAEVALDWKTLPNSAAGAEIVKEVKLQDEAE